MESFEVKSQNLTSNYEFKNDSVYVSGSYASDKLESEIQGINGNVHYAPTVAGELHGAYIGNFTGTVAEDGIEYSLSKMTRSKTLLVWGAIDGIESHVIPVDENEGEGGAE